MNRLSPIALIGLLTLAYVVPAKAQRTAINLRADVGMDQKLGAQAPLDTTFHDETGKAVKFGDFFQGNKPVVLSLPFYKCQGTCLLILDGQARCFRNLDFKLGKDYEAVVVSINPAETKELAAEKKKGMLEYLGKPEGEKGWHFLTGTEPEIKRLANAVGYRYIYDTKTNQYVHVSGIIVLTPQGKTSHYFYGVDYKPGTMRLALVESSQNKIGSPVDKIMLFCTAYDPTTGKYGFVIIRLLQVSGTMTAMLVGTFMFLMFRRERRQMGLQPKPLTPA